MEDEIKEVKEVEESTKPEVEESPSIPVDSVDPIDYTDSIKTITDFIKSYEKEQELLKEEQSKDIKIDDEKFKDPTPKDPITKEDILIYYLNEDKKISDGNKGELEDLNKSITSLNDDITTNSDDLLLVINKELLPKLEAITENQVLLNEKQDSQLELDTISSGTLYSYATIYIPLAIVCFLLWRFFSTFLRMVR